MLSYSNTNKNKIQQGECQSQNPVNKTEPCGIKYRKEVRNMSPLKQKYKSEEHKETLNDLSGHGFIFGSTPRSVPVDYIGMRSENESDNNISSCSTLDIDNKVLTSSSTGVGSESSSPFPPIVRTDSRLRDSDFDEDILSDIDGDISQSQIPRSLSCLCCSKQTQPNTTDFNNSKCEYILVTEAPKLQQNVFTCTNTWEDQVQDLTQKLKQVDKERNEFKKRLAEAVEERERSYRRLEVISSAHESRITEMHCVIAELSKKLRSKLESTILEETEHDGSEFSFHEESVYNSEMNLTNPDAECQTEPLDVELPSDPQVINETVAKTQVEALQEEVLHLKAQIALLQSQIANNIDSSPEVLQDENVLLSLEEKSIGSQREDDKKSAEQQQEGSNRDIYSNNSENNLDHFAQHTPVKCMTNNITISADPHQCNTKRAKVETLIPKMAERVKLRRTVEDMHITGTDILNSGIRSTEIVEHLVSDMMQCDTAVNNFTESTQLQVEIQRLQRRIEHYKLRNTVLSLTLDECKEHCEHLYLLCGKYESNAIALQMALNCSDRAIEAYDVMLALLESKLALLKEKNISSQDSRRAVEAVARHLLDRLESEKNLNENSLGPWQNTVCINSSQLSEPWTIEDDNRLRNHVSKLKGRRAAMQNTVVTLESPYSPNFEKVRIALEMNKEIRSDHHQMDMEMAVLMQELMSLREDVIETKQKLEFTEKEKKLALDKVFVLEEALSQLQSQLADSEAVISLASKDRSSYSEAEHSAIIERQLVEALTRESQLKNRIQALINSVSECRKSSDEKYAQVQNNVTELQKANINLSQSLEQCKKKYQSKIKRLEQKVLQMSIDSNIKLKTQDVVPETTL